MVLSNTLQFVWGTYKMNGSGSFSFAVSFTSVYNIISQFSYNAGESYNIKRFPYEITTSGFTWSPASGYDVPCYFLATGIKS